MRRAIVLAALGWLTAAGPAIAQDVNKAPAAPWSIPSDADIRKIRIERSDTQHQSVGIVVGVIDAKGRRIVSYGHLNQGDTRPLNGDVRLHSCRTALPLLAPPKLSLLPASYSSRVG